MVPTARRVLLAACAGLLALGLSELALRLTPDQGLLLRLQPRLEQAQAPAPQLAPADEPFKPARDDDVLGYVLRPSWQGRHRTQHFDVAVSTNALGQRGPETSAQPAQGVCRVLVLGDSITFGWGVEHDQRWTSLLAERLHRPDQQLELLTAGAPGWGPDHHALWLQREGLALQPDLVLLQLSTNDIDDVGRSVLKLGDDLLPVSIGSGKAPVGGVLDLVVEELARAGHDTTLLARRFAEGEDIPEARNALRHIQRLQRVADQTRADTPLEDLSPDELAALLPISPRTRLRWVMFLVAAMEQACAARGVPLRVLLADLLPNADAEPPASPILDLQAWAAARHPPALDTSTVIPRDRSHGMFFPRDPHWTKDAHAPAGEAAARWLAAGPVLALQRRGVPLAQLPHPGAAAGG